ncbi:YcnI family protein [Mycobacterium sp. DL592]|uniref:YcnI family copper-binding membrane protein n=1 Tax=Mycobacterium sp. DL592 TaxID=2675524 RepID=UPI00142025BA|nr:YcnI family protein [Mycobacterium sp. DL592]
MKTNHQLVPRALTTAAVTATLTLGAWICAAGAGAHVHVESDHAIRGDDALVTFQVPNESEKGSATTQVTITLPNVASASTDVLPGWTAKLDRNAAGAYSSVTFTATPNAGIGAQQFELFPISVQLPDADSVTFPVVQTYADGTTVHWDQPPLANGEEPEFPVPTLTLAAGPHEAEEHHATPTAPPASAAPSVSAAPAAAPAAAPDNTARALAGGALLVGAIGVGVALARRRT